MKHKKIGNKYIIRIDRGEKIIEQMKKFIQKEKIDSGVFKGIGAVSHVTLEFYSFEEKEYIEQNFKQDMEITSVIGNVSKFQNEIVVHAHINLADKDMNVKGGHLKEGIVGGTCEIFFETLNKKIYRKKDEETNLNLLEL